MSPSSDFSSLRTLRDLVRYGVSRFNEAELAYGQSTLSALDEASYLVLHALHLPPGQLEPFLDAAVLPHERSAVLDLLHQRVESRLPAPYLTHEAWLQGYPFYVDERVLIPRSFIAELLVDALQPWVQAPEAVTKVLDLCTGSACLAILAAERFPQATIEAVDISPDALEVAYINVDEYGLEERVHLIESDLLAQLPPQQQYDFILCNPPYVNSQSMAALPPEFLHEPQLALAGGDDGMDLIRTILGHAPHYLKDQGFIILEIGHEKPFFEQAFPQLSPHWLSTSGGDEQVLLLFKEQLL